MVKLIILEADRHFDGVPWGVAEPFRCLLVAGLAVRSKHSRAVGAHMPVVLNALLAQHTRATG
jgi:hypothetical protein